MKDWQASAVRMEGTEPMADAVMVDHPGRLRGQRPASHQETAWPAVDVVLLTWRAGAKAVQALQALQACGYPDLRVIVVDNGSDDGSDRVVWEHVRRCYPTAVRLDVGLESVASPDVAQHGPVFVRSSVNRGFSQGMNLGLDLVVRSGRAAYFWTLNNDTLPQPGTVEALVARCEEDGTIGLCGCTQHIVNPDGALRLSLPGGFLYHRSTGMNDHIAMPARLDAVGRAEVERRMTAVVGSSFFGTKRFLDEVGLFATDRFIYGEELDWAARARKAGFRLGWAPQAVIRTVHTGTLEEVENEQRAVLTRYLGARARFRYARSHDRWFLPLVVGAQLTQVAQDLVRGRRKVAWAGLSGLVDGCTGRHRLFAQLGAAQYPGTVHA